MQIHRFDEDYSIPVSKYGSNFRIGPLTAPEARVQVEVMHLPPGGRIGRHPAVGRQLLCVVCAHVWPAVQDLALRIDHVGSTSVPGLAAKPIIDTDMVVVDEDVVHPVIERLQGIGYRWMGDLGVPGRQAFMPVEEGDLPSHHLYVVVENNRAHLDHWLLRDLLRDDPAARQRYGELKQRNVALADGDMELYGQAKAALVAELLARARAERGLEPVQYWQPDIDAGPT